VHTLKRGDTGTKQQAVYFKKIPLCENTEVEGIALREILRRDAYETKRNKSQDYSNNKEGKEGTEIDAPCKEYASHGGKVLGRDRH